MKASTATSRRPAPRPHPRNGGGAELPLTADSTEDRLDRRALLNALQAVADGDFSVRLPVDWTGLDGKIADRFNEIVTANQKMACELARVRQVVGREGKTRQRMRQLRESENRLRQQREALAEADRRKNEFLAMLAHELRNPLQPILTAIELARQPKLAPAELQWGRKVIERQVRLLTRLVDDLLDASRINSGKLELRREIVAMSQIVAAAVDSVRPLVDGKKLTLDVRCPDEKSEIVADGARLTQVLSNLLNNAVKFTPRGGNITLSVARENGEIAVRVVDDGTGLSETERARVFEMFYQGDARAGAGNGGLGLGLALVKQLVELHGGSVSARSPGRDQGSEFCVRLPATPTSC